MNSEIIKFALEEVNKVIEHEIEPLKKIKKKSIIKNENEKDSLLLELATEITPNIKNHLINYEYKKKMKNIKIEGFSKEIIELY
ncbi:hypothetical protein, partial [Ilyobacter sp.]|uniref:hypothetical protein n=1 Tax=Ilyobacter sp. TaxID=3100343 RepID=UPI003569165D